MLAFCDHLIGFLSCVGSMLCHSPKQVDNDTDLLIMQLVAFLKNKTGNVPGVHETLCT